MNSNNVDFLKFKNESQQEGSVYKGAWFQAGEPESESRFSHSGRENWLSQVVLWPHRDTYKINTCNKENF